MHRSSVVLKDTRSQSSVMHTLTKTYYSIVEKMSFKSDTKLVKL